MKKWLFSTSIVKLRNIWIVISLLFICSVLAYYFSITTQREKIEVPSVIGLSRYNAETILFNHGFKVKVNNTHEQTQDIPKNDAPFTTIENDVVTNQSPKIGEYAKKDLFIQLDVLTKE